MKNILNFVAVLLLIFSLSSLQAEVRLPAMVSDGMVLQRDTNLKIWGWAEAGESLTLKFKGKKYKAKANSDGEWEVILSPMKAGGPYTMEISASNKIVISDILVGDVWLCAGQSNMDHYMGRHLDRYAEEIASSENLQIRQLLVPKTGLLEGPAEDAEMQWEAADPERVLDFTVVGYFFARKLNDEYQVPMGIIKASVGGSRIETWTSEEGFHDFPEILKVIERNKDTAYVNQLYRKHAAEKATWHPREQSDCGLLGEPKWFDPGYEARNWKPINIPGYWEDQGISDLDGVVWYRRMVDVPASMCDTDALVRLGRITDADQLYINGTYIGKTTYKYPQRRYPVKKGVLKPGKNLFVIRVVNQSGKGGFMPDKPYCLIAAGDTLDLKGTWDFRVGEAFIPEKRSGGFSAHSQPTSYYNGMLAPLTNYAVRGALWYQGESNGSEPDGYRKLLPALIADWRSQWDDPEMPFLIAQLPNYMDVDYLPVESSWAAMREVQMQTALADPRVGCGINIDLGVWNDVHPGEKKPVGERLALQAMMISYGETGIVSSGPVCSSFRHEGGKVILSFDHTGSGLVSGNGEELAHFALAGEDGKFRWAKAEIRGEEVVVWCDKIPAPRRLRYAWANNPDFANLYNKEGLPASPFQLELKKQGDGR